MKSHMVLVFAITSLATLSGCANLTSPARDHVIDHSKAYWLDYDASRRGTLVLPNNVNVKTCAEPSPDVALSLVSKLEGSLKKTGVGEAEATAEFNATVIQLAKRTQMVMFLRESLFRLCEQSLNSNFEKKDIVDTYNKILEAAIHMVQTDQTEAKTKAQEVQIKARQLQLQLN